MKKLIALVALVAMLMIDEFRSSVFDFRFGLFY